MSQYSEQTRTDGSVVWGVGIVVILVLLAGIWIFALRSAKPDAGHETVLVHKPLIWGSGGVDPTPVKTGQTYVWFTTERVDVDVQPQQKEIHFDDLMSSDGVPLDFDSVIRLQVTDSVDLVSNFGPRWYENNVESEFKNRVRQAVRKHGMNETAIETTAVDAIESEVTLGMTEYIEKTKIPIRLIDVTVGRANPPDAIKTQRVETAAQEQRKTTMVKTAEAEIQRKAAEQSRAEADNAYRNAMGLSPDLFVRLESVKMQAAVCATAGAHCTFIVGDTDVTPVVNATPSAPTN